MSAASRFSPVFSVVYRILARLSSRNFALTFLRYSIFQKDRGRIGAVGRGKNPLSLYNCVVQNKCLHFFISNLIIVF